MDTNPFVFRKVEISDFHSHSGVDEGEVGDGKVIGSSVAGVLTFQVRLEQA